MEIMMKLEWKPKNFDSELDRHTFWKRIKHTWTGCKCCCCIEDGCKTHGWKRFEYTPRQMEERQRAYVRKVVNQVCHHASMIFRG